MGPVFRAFEPDRDRLVAIKVFALDLPPERVHQLVAGFERLIAAKITHPAIAAPLATGIDRASAYLVQDYVAGDSLDTLVRDHGAAPPADALRVAVQLAGSLDRAALADVYHGALHPRDVLIAQDETRITGLGVPRALEQVGTAAPVRRPYTAPERMAGSAWDRRADIFSLAAVIYEVLWGRRVSGTGTQVTDTVTELAGADLTALRRVFARALADEPADRYDTALAFAEALKEAFPGVVIVAPRAARPSSVVEPLLPLDEPAPVPELPGPPAPPDPIPAQLPLRLMEPYSSEPPTPGLARSRATWPLAWALLVGLALGFAGGYAVGNFDRPVGTMAAMPARPAAPAAATSPVGREWTEGEVPSKPTPTPTTGRESDVTLAPAAGPGRLLIRSTPSGAHVFVDDGDRGRTPVAVRGLARGAHRLRVVREGYATEDRRVVITANRSAQLVTIALARAARPAVSLPAASPALGQFGAVRLESRPAGAKVYIDDRLVGVTPLNLSAVSVGQHAVRLERDGYRHWTTSVRVGASGQNRVRASLEKP